MMNYPELHMSLQKKKNSTFNPLFTFLNEGLGLASCFVVPSS